jgi:hypothetical protein
VPKDLKQPVRDALALRGTPDLDRSALYYAVTNAAASVPSFVDTPGAQRWERLWKKAGLPELEVVGR